MKRLIALLLAGVLAASALSACSFLPKKAKPTSPTEASSTADTSPTKSEKGGDEEVDPDVASSAARKEEMKNKSSSAALSDYIKDAKESVIILPGGGEKRCAIPEILLDSSDAKSANAEITEKYGAYFDDPEGHNYVIELNYEAYLYDKFLSVYVKDYVDGGNTSGLCYCFDITDGSELSAEKLCSMTEHDYNTVIDTLKTNLTSYYDEKYSKLPGNDEERSKTLADSNIRGSKMFLNDSHELTAMVQIYAAVGGGRWVETIPAE